MIIQLHHGDCVEVLKGVLDGSIGAVISDPPYGIGFLGREWDDLSSETEMQEWHQGWLAECFRVLKPGGLIKAFSASRTYHRLAPAMTAVGFEVVGLEAWGYGTGFPRGADVSMDIDHVFGVTRGTIRIDAKYVRNPKGVGGGHGVEGADRPCMRLARERGFLEKEAGPPVSPEAIRFQGFGTGLKPSWEPFVVGRKPC